MSARLVLSRWRVNGKSRQVALDVGLDPNDGSSRPAPQSLVAAPIGIHLRTWKNDKMPPIFAFVTIYYKLPKPDVSSIPIARSINADDSVDLTRLKH